MATRIGFSTSKSNLVSRIIRWLSSSQVSHVFFIYHDQDFQRDMVMEATAGGFRIVPFSHYEKSIVKIVEPKHSIESGFVKAIDWLGDGYDYAGLFGMVLVELGRWFGRKWRNPMRSAKTMFCSEAVARVLVESGYPGTQCWDPQSIDPEQLLEFLLKEEA